MGLRAQLRATVSPQPVAAPLHERRGSTTIGFASQFRRLSGDFACNPRAGRASLLRQAAGVCLQTTVFCFVCAGVTVSVGVAPSLSATRSERTLLGEIKETSRSMDRDLYAQSRMAAAASVAYPKPQCARIRAQPSSG